MKMINKGDVRASAYRIHTEKNVELRTPAAVPTEI
jgi:hypothetical protein